MVLRNGNAVLTLVRPSRLGTAHRVISPPAFMQRLAALFPRPTLLQARLRPA